MWVGVPGERAEGGWDGGEREGAPGQATDGHEGWRHGKGASIVPWSSFLTLHFN